MALRLIYQMISTLVGWILRATGRNRWSRSAIRRPALIVVAQARVFLPAAAEDPAYLSSCWQPCTGFHGGEIAAAMGRRRTSPGDASSTDQPASADSRRDPVKFAADVRMLPLVRLSRAVLLAALDRTSDHRSAARMREHGTAWPDMGYVAAHLHRPPA
jgi:hypothetical protein